MIMSIEIVQMLVEFRREYFLILIDVQLLTDIDMYYTHSTKVKSILKWNKLLKLEMISVEIDQNYLSFFFYQLAYR